MKVEFPMMNQEKMKNNEGKFNSCSLSHSWVIRASSSVFCLLFMLASCANLFACAACAGGKTDSELAQGMNAGIFTLLGVVGIVLAGAASFGFFLVRRASRMSQLTGNEPVAQPTI